MHAGAAFARPFASSPEPSPSDLGMQWATSPSSDDEELASASAAGPSFGALALTAAAALGTAWFVASAARRQRDDHDDDRGAAHASPATAVRRLVPVQPWGQHRFKHRRELLDNLLGWTAPARDRQRALKELLGEYVDRSEEGDRALAQLESPWVIPEGYLAGIAEVVIESILRCRLSIVGTWVVHTDASTNGVGGFLSWNDGGRKRAVAFAFRRLTPIEQRLKPHDREMFAALYCLAEFRRGLLEGKDVRVLTDCDHVRRKFAECCDDFARVHDIAFRCEDFGAIELKHVPRRENSIADALSRFQE